MPNKLIKNKNIAFDIQVRFSFGKERHPPTLVPPPPPPPPLLLQALALSASSEVEIIENNAAHLSLKTVIVRKMRLMEI